MLAAGQPPDVFYFPPDLLPELAESRKPSVRSIRSSAKEDKAWMDDFVPVVLEHIPLRHSHRHCRPRAAVCAAQGFHNHRVFTSTSIYSKPPGIDWRDIQKHGWTWDRLRSRRCGRSTRWTTARHTRGAKIYGTYLWLWSDTMRDMLWTFGGEFFHSDADGNPLFRQVALDTPEAQAGLKFIRKMRLEDQTCYNPTGMAKDGSQEFINGNIGCVGPIGMLDGADVQDHHRFQMGCRSRALCEGSGFDRFPDRLDDEQRLPGAGRGL